MRTLSRIIARAALSFPLALCTAAAKASAFRRDSRSSRSFDLFDSAVRSNSSRKRAISSRASLSSSSALALASLTAFNDASVSFKHVPTLANSPSSAAFFFVVASRSSSNRALTSSNSFASPAACASAVCAFARLDSCVAFISSTHRSNASRSSSAFIRTVSNSRVNSNTSRSACRFNRSLTSPLRAFAFARSNARSCISRFSVSLRATSLASLARVSNARTRSFVINARSRLSPSSPPSSSPPSSSDRCRFARRKFANSSANFSASNDSRRRYGAFPRS